MNQPVKVNDTPEYVVVYQPLLDQNFVLLPKAVVGTGLKTINNDGNPNQIIKGTGNITVVTKDGTTTISNINVCVLNVNGIKPSSLGALSLNADTIPKGITYQITTIDEIGQIANNGKSIDLNTTVIANNVTNISTNTKNISDNVTQIATNTTSIDGIQKAVGNAVKLQGIDLASTEPVDKQILIYNGASKEYEPKSFIPSETSINSLTGNVQLKDSKYISYSTKDQTITPSINVDALGKAIMGNSDLDYMNYQLMILSNIQGCNNSYLKWAVPGGVKYSPTSKMENILPFGFGMESDNAIFLDMAKVGQMQFTTGSKDTPPLNLYLMIDCDIHNSPMTSFGIYNSTTNETIKSAPLEFTNHRSCQNLVIPNIVLPKGSFFSIAMYGKGASITLYNIYLFWYYHNAYEPVMITRT